MRITLPVSFFWGGGNWSDLALLAYPKSFFSSDFGHQVLKIRKIKNTKKRYSDPYIQPQRKLTVTVEASLASGGELCS